MTPARLSALMDVEEYAREEAERAADGKGPKRKPRPSANPAADLAALASM